MKIIPLVIVLIFSPLKILASDTVIIHGGQYTGNAYFNLSDYDRQIYIQGIVDGVRASELFDANSSVVHEFSDCMKNKPPSQLQAVIEKALRERPDLWHLSVNGSVLISLKKMC